MADPLEATERGKDQRKALVIALAQLDLHVGAIAANAERIIETARRARDEMGARLVVFPELSLTSYPPEDLLLREDFLDEVEVQMQRVMSAVSGIAMVIGYPRRKSGSLYNAAGVLCDGAMLVEYHKQALPNYSVFDEKRYFDPGLESAVFELDGHRIGLTICEDIWEPEPARQAARDGATLLLNLNASPFHKGKAPEREELLATRARENRLAIVYVNLVGGQDELVFDGGSFVVDRGGRLAQRLPFFDEALVNCAIDADGAPTLAAISEPLTEQEAIYRALVLGTRDYARKNGFKGAVLGLSGGIDSALVAALAVDALGAENVEVVLMPSRYTADMSNEDAVLEARRLGIDYRTIPIESAFNAFLDLLADAFAGYQTDTTEENIQARCRGVILMAISNKTGRILLTTGNKSEMSVGYATLYGDMAGGFAPIKDVPKMLVYALARWRNQRDGDAEAVIPERVIERPPSAELRPEQQDSDSLPPYDVLDAILMHYIEDQWSASRIVNAGFEEALVRRIIRLVDINEYKRRQAPPGVKITKRAFGRDRRFPITNGFR
ncbi:MAG TPA: NAD+ synthase [Chromatiaceae bacterium]|nr:NAD+ synthase [Chromatiaceae bacterium]